MRRLALAALVSLTSLPACSDDDGAPPEGEFYEATIRRTSHNIPHITAEDVGSLGFGQGYAFAEDHGCILADMILKVRSERAQFFGPGEDDDNINSDFARLHFGVYAAAQAEFEDQRDDVKELVRGYAAGYNAYLEEVGADGFSGYCKGEPWVRPIDEFDLFAYYIELGLLASGRALADFVGSAQPPGAKEIPQPPLSRLRELSESPLGSNGWGIGADLSETGRGMVFANPHFPWEGELMLWESQLTIPGELNVYGVGLLGVPGVLIGFNEAVGWTHTVSDGRRMTAYSLELSPDDPTVYVKDGVEVPMTSSDYTIEVLQDDGTTSSLSRTLWRSEYGPIIAPNPLGWTGDVALTFRDANIHNRSLIAQFLDMNQADSMDAFQQAHETNKGVPWVNTMSASADGRAWYIDSTPAPNLTQETVDALAQRLEDGDFLTAALDSFGVVMLEGSTSRDGWVEDDGAREPGLVPYAEMPQLERTDFIFNANDSHWLTNPAQPLEGYSTMYGLERTARSVRTRMNAIMLTEGTDGFPGADGKWSLAELQEAAFSNRSSVAELLRAPLVDACEADPQFDGTDLSIACSVLSQWDGTFDLDSPGAALFREWITSYPESQFERVGLLWSNPFDPEDPVNTPFGLNDAEAARENLAQAIANLEAAGLPLDVTMGDSQFTYRGDQKIPVHGGGRRDGITNLTVFSSGNNDTLPGPQERAEVINGTSALTEDGYQLNYGTSFIMTLEFTDDGPHAQALLTYGETSDPESEFFSDQTQLFSEKTWRDCLFTEEQIAGDPNLSEKVVRSGG